ncbi:MAG: hypothetical protein BGO57_12725 [Sphingomonadales bacterium 63-6]|nr:MAG: hypothetical protein BGO57_12725 [Sphingomonadales bacterium 63-6]
MAETSQGLEVGKGRVGLLAFLRLILIVISCLTQASSGVDIHVQKGDDFRIAMRSEMIASACGRSRSRK